MLEEYVEDNYYARFDICSYHPFREMHCNARFNVNNVGLDVKSQQSHSRVKSRSRVLGCRTCLKDIWRTITMQGLALTAITVSEKSTQMLDSM